MRGIMGRIAPSILIAVLASSLVACSVKQQPAASQPAAVAPAAKPTEPQVLAVSLDSEPQTLDPQAAQEANSTAILRQIYAGLLRFGPDLALQPDLARELPTTQNGGISADGLTYTFRLRDSLKWSDGTPMKAQAFVDAAKRVFESGKESRYADFYLVLDAGGAEKELQAAMAAGKKGNDLAPLKSKVQAGLKVSAPDDHTVVMRLSRKSPVFLQLTALWTLYPVRADLIAKHGDKWTEAGNHISTGPFTLAKWSHNERIELARNPHYHGTSATLEAVRIEFIKDTAIAFAAYQNGELDVVSLGPAEILQVRKQADIQAQFKAYPQLSTTGLTFNAATGSTANAKIRQALAGGFDREEYAKVVREGAVLPATGWIPPGMPGYDAQAGLALKGATDRSKALLKDAGFEGGRGVSVEILIANTSVSKLTAEWLQQQWQKNLGVTVTVRALEPATYVAERVKGNFQVVLGGWASDYPDPQNWWPQFRTGAGLNTGKYTSAEFDRLMEQADAELDNARRLEVYGQAQQIFLTDVPFTPLFHGGRSILVKPYVKGAVTTSMEGAIPTGNFLDRVSISGKQR